MTRRICCVCGIEHAPPIDDGRDEVVDSHGFCGRCANEQRLIMEGYFAELPADGARSL